MKKQYSFNYFSKFEWGLWGGSIFSIFISFLMVRNTDYITLIASIIGATALIFVSKGNVFGQILTVVFSLLYAVISFTFQYYGEMITYLGMTLPIAVLSVFSWMKNPYEKGRSEVKIRKLSPKKKILMILLTILITWIFYYILKAFETTNLLVSTISIATSFLASYLMLFRSPGYAIAYAVNDIVLIVLWILACVENISYFPMIICFAIFFINDGYGFFNWMKMMKKQKDKELKTTLV